MFPPTKSKRLLAGLLFCLLVPACGAGETPVTAVEQIVGTWGAQTTEGEFLAGVLEIQADGTVVTAGSLEKLDEGISDTWRIWVEDGLVLCEGPLLCQGTGSYQAVLDPDGKLTFTTVDDSCSWRKRVLDESPPGSLKEWKVEYIRVR